MLVQLSRAVRQLHDTSQEAHFAVAHLCFSPSGGAGALKTGMLGGCRPMPTLSPCAVIPRAGVLAGGTCPWEQALLYQPQEFSYPRDPSAKESLTGREPGEILCTRNFFLRSLHDADTIQTAVMGQSAVASPARIRTK